MHTTLTPSCLHDITFFSLKKPRSDPYNLGTSPKVCLWRSSEATTCCSSTGFPSSTSYCVIKPSALSTASRQEKSVGAGRSEDDVWAELKKVKILAQQSPFVVSMIEPFKTRFLRGGAVF